MSSPASGHVRPGPGPAEPHRVLLVCTGNLCRSPLAERLLRQQLTARGLGPDRVEVSSAGVLAEPDEDMDPRARTVLLERGADPDRFAGRRLTAALLAAADLVLTAERSHRAAAARLLPRATGTTFTLREFARLAAEPVPPGELATALRVIGARRGLVPGGGADDDIPDPLTGSVDDFRRCAETITAAAQPLVEVLVRGQREGESTSSTGQGNGHRDQGDGTPAQQRRSP